MDVLTFRKPLQDLACTKRVADQNIIVIHGSKLDRQKIDPVFRALALASIVTARGRKRRKVARLRSG